MCRTGVKVEVQCRTHGWDTWCRSLGLRVQNLRPGSRMIEAGCVGQGLEVKDKAEHTVQQFGAGSTELGARE